MIYLSICIPTYNRGPFLDKLLENIYYQSLDINFNIEVVVSDNNSNDNTIEVLRKWKLLFNKNYKYSINNKNLGADLNYQKVVSLAEGKYIWIIGSDDLLENNALNDVYKYLNNINIGILLFNRNDYDIYMNFISSRSWLNQDLPEFSFNLSNKLKITEYFKLCNSLGGVFSYLSSIIFLKEIWVQDLTVKEFNGTAYSHVFILLTSMLNTNNSSFEFRYINKYFIKNRTGNDSFLTTTKERLLLDFNGYKKLSQIPLMNIEMQIEFLRILSREHPVNGLKKTLTFYKLNNNEIKILADFYNYEQFSLLAKLHRFRIIYTIYIALKIILNRSIKYLNGKI